MHSKRQTGLGATICRKVCQCGAVGVFLVVAIIAGFNVIYGIRREARQLENRMTDAIWISKIREVENDEEAINFQRRLADGEVECDCCDNACLAPYLDGTQMSRKDLRQLLTSKTEFEDVTKGEVMQYLNGEAAEVTLLEADCDAQVFRFSVVKSDEIKTVIITLNNVDTCKIEILEENCFHADNKVYRLLDADDAEKGYESVSLRDIEIDDMLMTDLNGNFGKVIYRLHYIAPSYLNSTGNVSKICFDNDENNGCAMVSDEHLAFINGTELDNLMDIARVKIGDLMYGVQDPTRPKKVTMIERNIRTEVRTLITQDGTIIVDDMYYSCLIGKNKYDHLLFLSITKFMYWLGNDILKDNFVFLIGIDFRKLWRDDMFAFELSDRIVTFCKLFLLPITNFVKSTNGSIAIASIILYLGVKMVTNKKNAKTKSE